MKILRVDFGPLHVRVRTHIYIMCIHTCIPTHPPTFKHTMQKCIHTKNIITATEAGCLQTCIIFSGKRADVVTRNHGSQILERETIMECKGWSCYKEQPQVHVIWEQIHVPRGAGFPNALESCQSLWGVWVLSPGFLTHPALGVGHEG